MTCNESRRSRWEHAYAARGTADPKDPSPFLTQHLDKLPRGRALDLASGDGRHSLLLARYGYRVDAIDFAAAGLLRSRAAAQRARLDIRFLQADLESYPLPVRRYDVVLNIFFLQRSLWPSIKEALRPGGMVVVETFLLDQRSHGQPSNPAFLLRQGELRGVFADFEIIAHEEGLFPDADEVTYKGRIIARKPGPRH